MIRSVPREWLLCGVLLLATFLNYADRQALPVTAVRVKAELDLDYEQYGRVEGIFGLAFGTGALLGGIMADRISVRWLYPALVLFWSLAGFATGAVQTFVALWICRLALGLFEAGHWSCALRTTQRVFHPARRTLANGILQSGAPLGAILPSLLMLAVVDEELGSWRQVFYSIGVLGLPWTILWLMTVRAADLRRPVLQTVDAAEGGQAPMREVPFLRLLLTRRYLLLVAVIVCINTCWHYIRVWMPLVLEENLGYTSGEVQWFFIAYWLATFAGSMVSGWLTRELGRRGYPVHRARLSVFLGLSAITSLSVVAAFLPAGWTFLGLMLLIGFGSLGLFPIWYSLTQELSARNQGKVSGSLGFATWLILFFVHPEVGWLMDHYPEYRPYVFASVGLLPLLAWTAIAAFWGKRH